MDRQLGTVRFYNIKRGFGHCTSQGNLVFFHISSFRNTHLTRIPQVDDVLEFELGIDKKSSRQMAVDIVFAVPEQGQIENEQKTKSQ